MTPEERFLFDLQGYLHLKHVLTPDEVTELNAIAGHQFPHPSDAVGERTAPDVLGWSPAYQTLLDHPQVLPYLIGMLGPYFRLDHDYLICMDPGASRGPLHGGMGGMPDWWYACHDGVIRNGLSTLLYCLTPATAGEGGFVCIPGSHKSRVYMRFRRRCGSSKGQRRISSNRLSRPGTPCCSRKPWSMGRCPGLGHMSDASCC